MEGGGRGVGPRVGLATTRALCVPAERTPAGGPAPARARALESLAKGQPSAAADGRRLAHRSKSESRAHRRETPAPHEPRPAPPAALACEHHHCCVHNGCPGREPPRREAATQSARDAATCTEPAYTLSVKHDPPASRAAHSSGDEFASTRARGPHDVSVLLGKHVQPTTPPDSAADKKRPFGQGMTRGQGAQRTTRARTVASSDKTDSTSADEPLQRRARGSSYRQGPAVCKELIVSEADILALRGFVARTRPSALYRFDADDDYKRALFYAINPLVELERCARLERLLSSRSAAALPHFAARLGLAPREDCEAPPSPAPRRSTRPEPKCYRERSDSSDTDKENKEKHSSLNKERSEPLGVTKQAPRASGRAARLEEVAVMRAPITNGVARVAPRAKRPAAAAPERSKQKAARESEDSGVAATVRDKPRPPPMSDMPRPPPVSDMPRPPPVSDMPRPPPVSDMPRPPPVGTHIISKRASRANVKEYSNLEDHAIVAWVSAGARASQVGGNRVWRELQEQYERLTGRGECRARAARRRARGTRCATATCATSCRRWARCTCRPPTCPACAPPPLPALSRGKIARAPPWRRAGPPYTSLRRAAPPRASRAPAQTATTILTVHLHRSAARCESDRSTPAARSRRARRLPATRTRAARSPRARRPAPRSLAARRRKGKS